MKALLFVLSFLFLAPVQAATSGGKGGKVGFSSDSGHGNTGGSGGGGGAFSTTGRSTYRDHRPAPPLEERRKVSEQDCSKPVDLTSGNLRCK